MSVLPSIASEFRRYKALAEKALAQVGDEALSREPAPGANSIAVVMRHMAGNLTSRFTDFLNADGEKPWRDRDGEFEEQHPSRAALLAEWEQGWQVLFAALEALREEDLARTITIRAQPMSVLEALHRSLAHAAYHTGQIVLLARTFAGGEWKSLSIPRGGSAAYSAHPNKEKGPAK